MKQLVILSGKGGTGKTTVAAGLAHLAAQNHELVLVDADVDAPNLEIILQPQVDYEEPFIGGEKAEIDSLVCTACGVCYDTCRFGAISLQEHAYYVDNLSCEGCAACYYVCPSGAIHMLECESGKWYRSRTRFGELLHARLAAGAGNTGKMVSMLRQQALLAGYERKVDLEIIDGSPGIGCPVIAAVTGVDLALVVSEPTLSGIHDLERALDICRHLHVPALVSVNKADINPSQTRLIAEHCKNRGIALLPSIPYDEIVTLAMRQGCTVTEYSENPVAAVVRQIWDELASRLFG